MGEDTERHEAGASPAFQSAVTRAAQNARQLSFLGKPFSPRYVAMLIAPCLLSACGGSSGGGSVNSTPIPPAANPAPQFTSFQAVQSGVNTTVSGTTREGSVAVDATSAILQSGVSNPTQGNATVTLNVNSARQTNSLRIDGTLSGFNFNSGSLNTAGLLFGGAQIGVLALNATGSEQAAWLDPYAAGFNYQSFGVWGTGLVAGSTGKYGVASVGIATGGSAIPTAGTVAFRGIAAGIYTDGAVSRYAANANFNVDFGTRTIAFSTSNQTITDIRTNQTIPVTWLDLNGTMTYAAGVNNFSGNVSARGQTSFQNLTGTASGQFYGPNANEIGGTFFLRGSVNTLVGGFGGKQ